MSRPQHRSPSQPWPVPGQNWALGAVVVGRGSAKSTPAKSSGGSGGPPYLSPGNSPGPRGGPLQRAVAVGPNPRSQAKLVVAAVVARGHRGLQNPHKIHGGDEGLHGEQPPPQPSPLTPLMLSIPGPLSTHLGAGCPGGARPGPPAVAVAGPRGAVVAVGWPPQAVGMAPAGRGAVGARGRLHRGPPGLRLSWGWRSGGVRFGGEASFAPHSLDTATCPMPGRGATRVVTVGRTPQRLCVRCTSPFPALVPQFPHRGPSLGWAFALEISTAQRGESPAPQTRVFSSNLPRTEG